MPWCVVIGCRNNLKATKRDGKNVSYHIFPKNSQRRSAWLKALHRPYRFNPDSSYVCSEHFLVDDFECNSLKEQLLNIKIKRQLKRTAVPSVNITTYLKKEPVDIMSDQVSEVVDSVFDITDFEGNTKLIDKKCCVVASCTNSFNIECDSTQNSNNILFHKFPTDTLLCNKWLEFCNLPKDYLLRCPNSYVCSEHFDKNVYKQNVNSESMHLIKRDLKNDAVPTINDSARILNIQHLEDHNKLVMERKKLVDKLLADYEKEQKNEGHLKGMVTKYPSFFSPKINPNAKLGDKLRLLKAKNNSENYFMPKKRKMSSPQSNQNSETSKLINSNSSQNNDKIIQVSAVKGGLMLHAISHSECVLKTSVPVKNEIEIEEEIIIVTEDEASNIDLSSYEEQPKENNTEVIVVTELKDAEDTRNDIESIPKKYSTTSNKSHCMLNQMHVNENQSTLLYTAKVSLSEDKGCQVIIPCKGCEHRSLKINKLLRERTRMLSNLNQSSEWKNPDEINTLKRMNGVLALLLMQYVGEKNSKKSPSIRVDIMQDTIERVNRGWTMQDLSETLCQTLSANAYDEFAKMFPLVNEI